MRRDVKEEYFDWMYNIVCNDQYSRRSSYRSLLHYLDDTDFTYTIGMDGNRAEDGVDLRYRFAYEKGYDYRVIADSIDDHPCSILEMMVALAIRCEEHIMEDSSIGDRTGQWFWNMIVSLGLGTMTDEQFDFDYVEEVVYRFLNRRYSRNGKGGLFTIEDTNVDMRSVEIWYQMCWYLDRIV